MSSAECNETCCCCYEPFLGRETVACTRSPLHVIHRECYQRIMRSRVLDPHCPLCRAPLPTRAQVAALAGARRREATRAANRANRGAAQQPFSSRSAAVGPVPRHLSPQRPVASSGAGLVDLTGGVPAYSSAYLPPSPPYSPSTSPAFSPTSPAFSPVSPIPMPNFPPVSLPPAMSLPEPARPRRPAPEPVSAVPRSANQLFEFQQFRPSAADQAFPSLSDSEDESSFSEDNITYEPDLQVLPPTYDVLASLASDFENRGRGRSWESNMRRRMRTLYRQLWESQQMNVDYQRQMREVVGAGVSLRNQYLQATEAMNTAVNQWDALYERRLVREHVALPNRMRDLIRGEEAGDGAFAPGARARRRPREDDDHGRDDGSRRRLD